MQKTVLITGTSGGIGKAAAEKFMREGWNVIATARDAKKITLNGSNLTKLNLDVTKPETISKAVKQILAQHKTIDVLVNNAGYGLVGIMESLTLEEFRAQYDTNVFGLISCMQAVLPTMRKQGSGTIINISSMGGKVTFPYYSAYHSTKFAVEGLSESMQYELEAVGIKIRLVEPGSIKTDFYSSSMDLHKTQIKEYQKFQDKVVPWMTRPSMGASEPSLVADIIYRAATDNGNRLRYTAGWDAKLYTLMKRFLPLGIIRTMIKGIMKI